MPPTAGTAMVPRHQKFSDCLESARGLDFVHNLLHMTGEKVLQPFHDPEQHLVALFNGSLESKGCVGGSVNLRKAFSLPHDLRGDLQLGAVGGQRVLPK